VSVLDTPPDGLVLERAFPGFDGTAGDGPITTDETGTAFTTGRSNGFFDFATVHAVTTASLGSLAGRTRAATSMPAGSAPTWSSTCWGTASPKTAGRGGRCIYLKVVSPGPVSLGDTVSLR
jgi:hypothetical protein